MAGLEKEPSEQHPIGLPTTFDPSFENVGLSAGLEIWRVEQFEIVKKPKDDRCHGGEFYEGDSYLLLHTKASP